MSSQADNLHFLVIPLLSQSHIIPLTDFAKLLARRGAAVSIITTPRNFIRYKASFDRSVAAGLKIQMIPLGFPGREAGLPPGIENLDSLASMDSIGEFFRVCELLKAPLEQVIESLDPKPSCVISSNSLPWTQQVAEKARIPRYVFETTSCFSLMLCNILSRDPDRDSDPFVVSGIPHRIELTREQLPETMRKSRADNTAPDGHLKNVLDEISKAKLSARATLVNTFEELEPEYVHGYRKEGQRLWCIGPVSLSNEKPDEKSERGDTSAIDGHRCISWLDSMKPGSVVYACFGSLCHISAAQIREIGLGLEASGFPFIWIIRGLNSSAEVEKWLVGEGFEQRVKGRGLVIRGWAPQVLILSHSSVGGFMTHCGWNSTLEGVSTGLPMITWPMFAEQFLNEKFIVHVLKIGVPIDQTQGLVKRDEVKKCVEDLMDERGKGKNGGGEPTSWEKWPKERLRKLALLT